MFRGYNGQGHSVIFCQTKLLYLIAPTEKKKKRQHNIYYNKPKWQNLSADSRVLKQYHPICNGELHTHTFWKLAFRVLLSCGRELECLSTGHQSHYASLTIKHEQEPIEPAKWWGHGGPVAIHHKIEMYIHTSRGHSKLQEQGPGSTCQPWQFTSIPPTAHTSGFIRGESKAWMIKWKRRKMPKLRLQMGLVPYVETITYMAAVLHSCSRVALRDNCKGRYYWVTLYSMARVLGGAPGRIHSAWK